MAESSSTPPSTNKPVIVRVKRKAFQSALDAFWLEIHERPLKRPLLDFGNLSISDASSSRGLEIHESPLKRPLLDFGKLSISDASSGRVEELKTKKILVRHVETVTSSESTFDVLRSFVPNSSGELNYTEKNAEGKRSFKTVKKQDQILSNAKQRQEDARFEQIWRSRKEKKEAPEDEAIYEMYRLYDIVRVDAEEQEVEVPKEKDTDLDDHRMMAQYLPLLRDFLPSAAMEIESDIRGFMSKQASSDGYVYDFYTVNEDANVMEGDSANPFPLVQVDDDDEFYDGPDDSGNETDDSNAENNPLNEYPDEEEMSEDEVTSKSSDEKSDDESGSQISIEYVDPYFEEELYSEGDDEEPFH